MHAEKVVLGMVEGGFGVFHPIGADKDGGPDKWLPLKVL